MTRFWLADVSKARFTMVRVMLGVTLLLWILGYLPDLIRPSSSSGTCEGPGSP